jgi:hypothetical protein
MMRVSVNRMLHGTNGVWDPEWETHGFKPRRRNDGSSDGSSDGKESNSVQTSRARKDTNSQNALERLRARRGVKVEDSEEPSVDNISELDDSITEPTVERKSPEDLAAKIRAKLESKKSA